MNKDVIYVDVDDEITTVIDKVNSSEGKVVALVLPKRAGVFQSVVNMKLLKRRAEAAHKHLVLITSEASLMPLAGVAGVHVAQTLQSKPEVPSAGGLAPRDDDDLEETASLDGDFDSHGNGATPVGALAANSRSAAVPGFGGAGPEDDSIELDNTAGAQKNPLLGAARKKDKDGKTQPKAGQLSAAATADRALNGARDSKPRIPNFKRFQTRILVGGVVLVLLIAGWIVANNVLPKAVVTVKTDSSDVDKKLDMTLDTAATSVNPETGDLPAQVKQEMKSSTQTVPASGQENKGEKAQGEVKFSATMCAPNLDAPADLPAGTGITANGNTYLTQSAASFSLSGASGSCAKYSTDTVSIVAIKGGQNYNVGGDTTFSAAGGITGKGQTGGGTDSIVKVVQQADIDSAKQKLTASQDQNSIKGQLQSRLEDDGVLPLPSTFFAGVPTVNVSSNVGDEAENITVTQATTYTMFGVKKADLGKLVTASLKDEYDSSKQSVLDDGVAAAKYAVVAPGPGPQLDMNVSLTATIGPKLDTAKLAESIVGMKSGEVKNTIKANPGVSDVTVKYSPFWVTKAPKAEKITVQYEKSGNAAN